MPPIVGKTVTAEQISGTMLKKMKVSLNKSSYSHTFGVAGLADCI